MMERNGVCIADTMMIVVVKLEAVRTDQSIHHAQTEIRNVWMNMRYWR